MRHGTLKYLSRKLNILCIEKQDETKNRKDIFTEGKRPFHNLHQTIFNCKLTSTPAPRKHPLKKDCLSCDENPEYHDATGVVVVWSGKTPHVVREKLRPSLTKEKLKNMFFVLSFYFKLYIFCCLLSSMCLPFYISVIFIFMF